MVMAHSQHICSLGGLGRRSTSLEQTTFSSRKQIAAPRYAFRPMFSSRWSSLRLQMIFQRGPIWMWTIKLKRSIPSLRQCVLGRFSTRRTGRSHQSRTVAASTPSEIISQVRACREPFTSSVSNSPQSWDVHVLSQTLSAQSC